MSADSDELILLGKVNGLFGVKGWLKIYSDTQPRENILSYSPWYLKRGDSWEPFKVLNGKPHGKTVIAHLETCVDRDEAAKLIGREIAIKREQLPAASEGEVYWTDLEGMQVITEQDVELGVVDHLFETGANDVLVVHQKKDGERIERLIPFIREQVIKQVDLENKRLVVDWDPDF